MMWLDTKTIMAEHIDYKVVIPSAGLGTRLGSLTKNLNKALVSVDNKPVISHIIEKFPTDIEIVIAVGYKKEVLIDYLKAAHNNRKITTVNIDKYMGDGSGLGYTLLKCCDYLQCPFVFCTNDTLTTEDIPEPNYDWAAYSSESFDSDICRSIEVEEHLIKSIKPDILVVGSDWEGKYVVGAEYAKDVIFFPRVDGYSTTKVLKNDNIR